MKAANRAAAAQKAMFLKQEVNQKKQERNEEPSDYQPLNPVQENYPNLQIEFSDTKITESQLKARDKTRKWLLCIRGCFFVVLLIGLGIGIPLSNTIKTF